MKIRRNAFKCKRWGEMVKLKSSTDWVEKYEKEKE